MALVMQTIIIVYDELNTRNTYLGFGSYAVKIFLILNSSD